MFIADVGGGAMSAVIGILAALVARGRAVRRGSEVGRGFSPGFSPAVGPGAFIDISMHHASLYWLMLPAARRLVKGTRPEAPDLPTDGSYACYNVYECADGKWIALGALEEKFWTGFCARIGRTEWSALQYDAAAQPAIIESVRALMRTRARDAWVAVFEADDICVSPVRDPAEALAAANALLTDDGAVVTPRIPFIPGA
jgi:crotonobetainyl-CoA:carnitine CoA-transferase CaiB-like acyl-CoA transferase